METTSGSRLSSRTRRVVEALADTIIPGGEPGRPGALEMNAVDRLMDWLDQFPGGVKAFTGVCWAWEFSPLQTGRLTRFSRLSPEERTRVLEDFERSRLSSRRWALMGLKSVFMASFYNNPELWPKIGYAPDCLGEVPKAAKRG